MIFENSASLGHVFACRQTVHALGPLNWTIQIILHTQQTVALAEERSPKMSKKRTSCRLMPVYRRPEYLREVLKALVNVTHVQQVCVYMYVCMYVCVCVCVCVCIVVEYVGVSILSLLTLSCRC